MGSVIPFPCEHAFNAEVTKIIGDAFDKTLTTFDDTEQPEEMRKIIARRIIDAASRGERDPDRLCAAALVSIGVARSA